MRVDSLHRTGTQTVGLRLREEVDDVTLVRVVHGKSAPRRRASGSADRWLPGLGAIHATSGVSAGRPAPAPLVLQLRCYLPIELSERTNMKVQDIMTRSVHTCTPETSLPQVAKLMWGGCCGVIPVIDHRGHVAGVITDRDIGMALMNTSRRPGNVAAREAMSHTVHSCSPEEDIRSALTTMRLSKIRRLPVIGMDGLLKGILSMDDIVLRGVTSDAPSSPEIVAAMREILTRVKEEPLTPETCL
jgi:CBS domain-containing protein